MKRVIGIFLSACALHGCGERNPVWDNEAKLPVQSLGLHGSVAVLDSSLDRVLMLTAGSDHGLGTTALGVGKSPTSMRASVDGKTLFVLSDGVQPRRSAGDEPPSLTAIDGDVTPRVRARWTLTDPVRDMAIDPLGEWVVMHGAHGVVANPNELLLVRVDSPSSAPISKTIRSFGGSPQRLSFTPVLTVPEGAPRRFLIVETDHDVSLVDLLEPQRDEVTIVLPKRADGASATPVEVVSHDGDPDDPTDARIAIRLAGDSNVVIVELSTPPNGEDKPFKATINIADVGGTPSSIAFVRTDGGLRLAALVPNQHKAALVDLGTTVVESVGLAAPYDGMSLVTDAVKDKPLASDIALLWSRQNSTIAFWSLGKASGTPYRSVDAYEIGASVKAVHDVPGESHAHLKLLETTQGSQFFVLDLDARQSFPMLANAEGFELRMAPDGNRAWAMRPNTHELAKVDLADLHPTSLVLERPVSAAWDVSRADGGRSLVALHVTGPVEGHASLGATVLDSLSPDTASSRFHPGLLLGGLE